MTPERCVENVQCVVVFSRNLDPPVSFLPSGGGDRVAHLMPGFKPRHYGSVLGFEERERVFSRGGVGP